MRLICVMSEIIVTRRQCTSSVHDIVVMAALHDMSNVIMQQSLDQSTVRLSTCQACGAADPCRPTESFLFNTHFPHGRGGNGVSTPVCKYIHNYFDALLYYL